MGGKDSRLGGNWTLLPAALLLIWMALGLSPCGEALVSSWVNGGRYYFFPGMLGGLMVMLTIDLVLTVDRCVLTSAISCVPPHVTHEQLENIGDVSCFFFF